MAAAHGRCIRYARSEPPPKPVLTRLTVAIASFRSPAIRVRRSRPASRPTAIRSPSHTVSPAIHQAISLSKSIGQSEAVQLTRGADADFSPAWSPDGRWIAFLRYSGPGPRVADDARQVDVMLIPAIGGPERRVAELNHPESPRQISWHPGAKSIAVVDRGVEWVRRRSTSLSMEDGTQAAADYTACPERDSTPAFCARWEESRVYPVPPT